MLQPPARKMRAASRCGTWALARAPGGTDGALIPHDRLASLLHANMYGPEPTGHFTRHSNPGGYRFLLVGDWYQVIRAFADYELQDHPVGETWRFLGWSYAAYDDGLSLYVSLDGQREWLIRLQDWPDRQGPVIERFGDYIAPARTPA